MPRFMREPISEFGNLTDSLMMQLSDNFTLDEFLISQTAERHGIDMTPPRQVVLNIKKLVNTCLQPLREAIDAPIVISSGYRPVELNTLIGGSDTSAHMMGRAADFRAIGLTPLEVCEKVVDLELPYDQVIHEFGRWVHLGIAMYNRGEALTAYRAEGRTRYVNGLFSMADMGVRHV